MSTTQATTTVTRPRRRLFRRLALIVVAVVVLYATWFVIDDWRSRREWEAACAEADRLDPGWRYDDLVARIPQVPDDRNSVTVAFAAARLQPAPIPGPGGRRGVSVLSPNAGTSSQYRLSAEALAHLQAELDRAAPALTLARTLADLPSGRIEPAKSPLILSVPPNSPVYQHLTIVKLLNAHAIVQAEVGNADDALTSLRAMIHASRPLTERPSLLDVLIAVAERFIVSLSVERVLAQGEPSPAALDALRKLLEQEIDRPLLINAFRGERAMVEDTIRAIDDGRVSRADVARAGYLSNPSVRRNWTGLAAIDNWIQSLLGRSLSRWDAAAMVRQYTWVIERLEDAPDTQAWEDEWAALRAQAPSTVKEATGHLARYATDMRLDETWPRAAVVALAAEHFRRVRGRWPTNADELVPDFLTRVPRDPQDLKPLRMAHTSDGLVIYSIGADRKDDGGDVNRVPPPGRDVGLRLWNPDKRRQPAPAPRP